MIAITALNQFVDIDTLASCFAMKNLLDLTGLDSEIVLPMTFNQSITKEMYEWFDKDSINDVNDYDFYGKDVYILDISDPTGISPNIMKSQVKLIFDHHLGYESNWKNFKEIDFRVEKIGATATLVYEYFFEKKKIEKMDLNVAKLLFAAINCHTFNFKSQNVTSRDIEAANSLKKVVRFDVNWFDNYYFEVEKFIRKDIVSSIQNDSKMCEFLGKSVAFGQLEMWDGVEFILENLDNIEDTLVSYEKQTWLFTLQNLSDGTSYVYTKDIDLTNVLRSVFEFKGNIGRSENFVRRKDIIKLFN